MCANKDTLAIIHLIMIRVGGKRLTRLERIERPARYEREERDTSDLYIIINNKFIDI